MVAKTYKLYINGEFVRSESGRSEPLNNNKGKLVANVSTATRKDFRNAVVAARNAFGGWCGKTPYNRSQILYRLAEMIASREGSFVEELVREGATTANARTDVRQAVDLLVHHAGWCDKYQHLFSSVNPVSAPFHNFSSPEAMGVVGMILPSQGLSGMVACIAQALAGGNAVVTLSPVISGLTAVTLAEAIATSDVPAGAVNILVGNVAELQEHFGSHMDVNATVVANGDPELIKFITLKSVSNLKCCFDWSNRWMKQDPYGIMDLQEVKTTWQPIERIMASGPKY